VSKSKNRVSSRCPLYMVGAIDWDVSVVNREPFSHQASGLTRWSSNGDGRGVGRSLLNQHVIIR